MTMEFPFVSIVIPVFNSRGTVAKCLNSLLKLDYPEYEIIIVDDGSTDGTPEICESFDRVRVIRLDRGGPSHARNVGVEHATGDFIAFTDGDCVVNSDWLTELMRGFTGPNVAGVGGDQKSPDDETANGRLFQDFMKSVGMVTGYIKTSSKLKETSHNPSCNSIYRKDVFNDAGGFDESLWPGEDVDLDRKITMRGHTLIFNPAAIVKHYRTRTVRGFARMMLRYGACQWPLVMKYGLFRALHFVPIALVCGSALVAVLLWRFPAALPLLLLPPAAAFAWFLYETGSVLKSAQFLGLLVLTLAVWHWGFLTGHWRARA